MKSNITRQHIAAALPSQFVPDSLVHIHFQSGAEGVHLELTSFLLWQHDAFKGIQIWPWAASTQIHAFAVPKAGQSLSHVLLLYMIHCNGCARSAKQCVTACIRSNSGKTSRSAALCSRTACFTPHTSADRPYKSSRLISQVLNAIRSG